MKEKRDRPGEESLINFLIDREALSDDEKSRIEAAHQSEIEAWQELVGEAPSLSEPRWHKIKAGFWQRAEKRKRGTGLYLSLAAVTVSLLLLVFITSNRPPSLPSVAPMYAGMMEDGSSGELFENFVDSLMPVEPVPESIWFTVGAEENQDEESFEDLLLLTNDFIGELS